MVTAYKKADGVSDASVDFKAKTATITYDPKKTNTESLIKVLNGTKYTASVPEAKK